ncbi:hypothetical protein [Mucilaginibacter sp. OK283]|uniref:hypothetical protein n=1 Tax=Mucilaginibacter sp. OK283 TaxID=1881049 RepID=UPI0008C54C1E|nr:hypothetical protein [Mucilaginibacter sp. OK283]SEP42209.1 hypothetical protein SAMN05428947_1168 [Mucilaginibacter sp. OK283]
MTNFKTRYKNIILNGSKVEILQKDNLNKFNESILGLGKIDTTSKQISALSVIFDLEGFTSFCNQIDPQLAVPEYMIKFLTWIFSEIRLEVIDTEYDDNVETFYDLPFFSKFLGDGILFLWNTKNMSDISITNVVVSMYEITQKYQTEFLPIISKSIAGPPPKLRCGVARGAVYSIGSDFVGPCINMSARLQKLNNLSLCFSRKGINPENVNEMYKGFFLIKKVNIRGIGSNELVCVVKSEFDKLDKLEREKFVKM